MGFFSNLGDAFSGKNYKRSELVFKKSVNMGDHERQTALMFASGLALIEKFL